MKRRFFLSIVAALLALVAFVFAPAQQPAPAAQPDTQMVAMRDGVKLATDIYLPEGKGPWPVILVRTPYGKSGALMNGQHKQWVESGYAYVAQDCRGTGKSEGKYMPFMDDHLDGYDTVEWAAKQSWSNGKVGMTGASAMGITANQAAIMAPPHLVAIYTMIAPSSAYQQAVYTGGIFRKEMNEAWLKRQQALDLLDLTFKHYKDDGYLDIREGRNHWAKVQVPAYNQGGWYDIFVQGNIDNFVGLQSRGGGRAAGHQKLLMGPWGHGKIEEVTYPANSAAPSQREAQRWFDYWLKGVNNGIMDEPAVRYYVMGDVTDPKAPGNEWRTAPAWPVPAKETSYFLGPKGQLGEKIASETESVETYQYDPKNPVPTIGGANLFAKKGPMDQRPIGERKDVLKFMTAPLESPVEVTGPLAVELWAESDCPDTDWTAKLVDVYPDGTERLVQDSGLRARFREGFDHEVFMKKGEVYKFKIDLWSTSLVFNKGHRIAVHISSSNDPRFDPNPNTGKPLRADGETRVATNTIHHDRAHPSRILLPVVRVYKQQVANAQ
ncbi:MAG TPA: CocE/NonD family hydrolase [Blastocatellia bacterium]|nr:CocE/NonD family hydrolase [Blastocatellia bacterium]